MSWIAEEHVKSTNIPRITIPTRQRKQKGRQRSVKVIVEREVLDKSSIATKNQKKEQDCST